MDVELVLKLRSAEDIRAAFAFLSGQLGGVAMPGPTVPTSLVGPALEDLGSRIGPSLASMVQKTLDFSEWVDLNTFASHVGRPYASVRASFNSPLKRALNSVKKAYPSVPDLFEWRRAINGRHWEFRVSSEWREALAARPLVFDTIPGP